MENKLTTKFYKKYVGCYAKRFYAPFDEVNMYKIIGFRMKRGEAFFKMEDKTNTSEYQWYWDVEDCVIITNEAPMIEDERVANINHPDYKGYNPYGEV
jgi:hypothetical protein